MIQILHFDDDDDAAAAAAAAAAADVDYHHNGVDCGYLDINRRRLERGHVRRNPGIRRCHVVRRCRLRILRCPFYLRQLYPSRFKTRFTTQFADDIVAK